MWPINYTLCIIFYPCQPLSCRIDFLPSRKPLVSLHSLEIGNPSQLPWSRFAFLSEITLSLQAGTVLVTCFIDAFKDTWRASFFYSSLQVRFYFLSSKARSFLTTALRCNNIAKDWSNRPTHTSSQMWENITPGSHIYLEGKMVNTPTVFLVNEALLQACLLFCLLSAIFLILFVSFWETHGNKCGQ